MRAEPVGPGTTYIRHTDEQGRTRTKILVQKRSYLDGGTEVMPGDIQTNHFCRRTDSCNGSNIVSRAAAGHEYASVQRAAAFEPFQKRRRSRSFFPGCITGPVSLFPIHASCQLTRLIDCLECQKNWTSNCQTGHQCSIPAVKKD